MKYTPSLPKVPPPYTDEGLGVVDIIIFHLVKATGGSWGKKMIRAHIRDLSETISTLFAESKKLAVLSSSVRRRFQKYRGFHTFREPLTQFPEN